MKNQANASRRLFIQRLSFSLASGALIGSPFVATSVQAMSNPSSTKGLATSLTFTLKSTDLSGQLTNAQFLNGMGYTGDNQSPQLYWEQAPAGTQSFAVTIHDLDAPTGSGFWHWVIFNIPASVHELKTDTGNLKKNLTPAGAIQSNTDFGVPGYGGAAPTPGPAHRYVITVHALSQKLELDKNASPAYVGFSMAGCTLERASLLVYGKKS